MKRILGSVICLGFATIYLATLLMGADEVNGAPDGKTTYTCKLLKREYESEKRATFTLEVTTKRDDLIVSAVCHLQEDQQSIGYFPLANVNTDVADAAVRFRINCLANTFIKTSSIRVEIREKKSSKQISAREISLRDAEAVAAPDRDK